MVHGQDCNSDEFETSNTDLAPNKRSVNCKTLFILFYFPPFARVGGRRWAKHIKYFQKFGESFHVLAGNFERQHSPWDTDIQSYRDKISRLAVEVYYPYFKQQLPKNIVSKLRWWGSFILSKIKEANYHGNFWDDSRQYEKRFLTKAIAIIESENINHVLLSAGPFAYCNIIPQLKRKFPTLGFTIDFRDYWEDSFTGLSEKRILVEKKNLQRVLESVNLILAPNYEMCKYYEQKFNKPSYCLPHCIDEDYQLAVNTNTNQRPKHVRFIYGGNLYSNLENYILELIELFKEIAAMGYEVELKIFTAQPNYIHLFEKNHINAVVSEQVSSDKFIKEVYASDIILLARPDWSPNAFSTKFFEAVALRKPILYIGPDGEVKDFIRNNTLGFILSDASKQQLAKRIVSNKVNSEIPNLSYSLEKHTFNHQTRDLISFWNRFYGFDN